ncbi:MAG TPA: amidohydrolase family protein [Pirellulales bacterium]|nr:amidohydrolase family protein [Pirellulales bacterium]
MVRHPGKPLTRREFHRRSASLFAGVGGFAGPLAAPKTSAAEAPQSNPAAAGIPIVDTHQHLWDLAKFRLAWVKPGDPLAKSFLMADYLHATSGLNVVKTVYMEVDVESELQDAEIEYVTELCAHDDNPMAAAVVSGRPASDGFAAYLARHKNNVYIRGLRQVLHVAGTPRGYCLEKPFVAGIRRLGEQGWSFDLCMRSDELSDAARLVDACPGTRFVLDHCGNASVVADDLSAWRRDIAALAERKNVIGKISGIIASGTGGKWSVENLAPIINHTLDVFGPDRVVFGGDWPVCTLAASFRQWVEALRAIVAERSQEERRKLFHDNAIKFYRLAQGE